MDETIMKRRWNESPIAQLENDNTPNKNRAVQLEMILAQFLSTRRENIHNTKNDLPPSKCACLIGGVLLILCWH